MSRKWYLSNSCVFLSSKNKRQALYQAPHVLKTTSRRWKQCPNTELCPHARFSTHLAEMIQRYWKHWSKLCCCRKLTLMGNNKVSEDNKKTSPLPDTRHAYGIIGFFRRFPSNMKLEEIISDTVKTALRIFKKGCVTFKSLNTALHNAVWQAMSWLETA